ncbi:MULTISPECIES: hypothetical protein [Helicobacter]|uniref:EF-hand domain-containing protein n=1 Tax=Helicobacter ibis TaxID=2962633 RepID=A0ABT4VDH8_9HELI|nr:MULTISPECIES: hypothetical protein [Helicobacter]MDA3967265.1 hypothetical protein [Helicobacter sp. WB40]MDA3968667.1 hypothetical protein [Helicobacter ibis]
MSRYYFKNKAKKAFLNREYIKALNTYSYLYNDIYNNTTCDSKFDNKLKELAQLRALCMLCDMALDYEEEARALYEYYFVGKKSKGIGLEKNIINMIESFDRNVSELNKVMDKLREIDVDKSDGILYSDFKKIVNDIGFKEAFENLMFSSKIIFTNKNEFLYFVRNLVEFGYEEVAINYFENTGNILYFDKEFMKLYKKIIQRKDL